LNRSRDFGAILRLMSGPVVSIDGKQHAHDLAVAAAKLKVIGAPANIGAQGDHDRSCDKSPMGSSTRTPMRCDGRKDFVR
jgi:hypothetical protein